jgi:predicted small secreted protein
LTFDFPAGGGIIGGMNRFILVGVFILSGLALSGCNTMRGIGADIEAAGESIQNVGN